MVVLFGKFYFVWIYLYKKHFLNKHHGTVETDCGTGYVYDVIADFDGKPSITLTEFAAQCRYEEDIAQLRQLLKHPAFLRVHLQ